MRWSTQTKFDTREQWMVAAVELLTPLFAQHEFTVPKNLKVSCGFPSVSALSEKKRRIGECWAMSASKSGHYEIFISPLLADEARVLDVLVHEVVHAVVGLECGHKGPFRRCALAVGLEGKMTATTAGPELTERLNAMSDSLGAYPHSEITRASNGQKKQGTRMLKVVCPSCEYTVRTTAKWVEVGLPTCPCGEAMELTE